MRTLFTFFLTITIVACFSQIGTSNHSISFVKKKNNAKTLTLSLPSLVKIKTHDKIKKDVLLIEVNDSILTALGFILDRPGTITNESLAIANQYWLELTNIEEDKTLSPEEKKAKRNKLFPLVYTDTVTYTISEISKIEFQKENPSTLAFYTCLSLYTISGMAVMVGLVGSIADSVSVSERNAFQLVGLVGLAGLAANLYWLKKIHVYTILLKRWNMVGKMEETIAP